LSQHNRFDKPAEEREEDNPIILFADEGQEIITGAESAFADHRAAGIIREARATIVLATQAYTSILGSLDKRYADVLMLNLSNELIFTCANHDSAVIASKNIGERESSRNSGVGLRGRSPPVTNAPSSPISRHSSCGSCPNSQLSFAIARNHSASG
jgi:hypothetical protein